MGGISISSDNVFDFDVFEFDLPLVGAGAGAESGAGGSGSESEYGSGAGGAVDSGAGAGAGGAVDSGARAGAGGAEQSEQSEPEALTLVLVGRTGNGKSATGNSILGKKSFISKTCSSGVTVTTQLHRTHFPDGPLITVIDTPGLFDCSLEHEFIAKEIVKCFRMADRGVDAILVVLSARARFSKEEEAAITSLKDVFGERIFQYMVLVFTGGDDFVDDDHDDFDQKAAFEDYCLQCPQSLRDILGLCKNRIVLFDNKTKDEKKKCEQRNHLLELVQQVSVLNDGQPYTNEIFQELQRADMELRAEEERIKLLALDEENSKCFQLMEERHRVHQEELKRIIDSVEAKLIETSLKLRQELEKEKADRLKAEEEAKESKSKSQAEYDRLKHEYHNACRERDGRYQCSIM